MGFRQARLAEGPSETEAVEKPEAECRDPWRPRRDTFASLITMHDLHGDKDDGEGNRRLDGGLRHMDETQRRQCESNRMGNREGGYRLDEQPSAAAQDEERQDEQQMIDAEQDMLDAEH